MSYEDFGPETYQIWISPTKYPGLTYTNLISEMRREEIIDLISKGEYIDGPPLQFAGSYKSNLQLQSSQQSINVSRSGQNPRFSSSGSNRSLYGYSGSRSSLASAGRSIHSGYDRSEQQMQMSTSSLHTQEMATSRDSVRARETGQEAPIIDLTQIDPSKRHDRSTPKLDTQHTSATSHQRGQEMHRETQERSVPNIYTPQPLTQSKHGHDTTLKKQHVRVEQNPPSSERTLALSQHMELQTNPRMPGMRLPERTPAELVTLMIYVCYLIQHIHKDLHYHSCVYSYTTCAAKLFRLSKRNYLF